MDLEKQTRIIPAPTNSIDQPTDVSLFDRCWPTAGFRKMIARLGVAARFDFPVHPHMLRHACGYKLAG
jgi:hypothetical protein